MACSFASSDFRCRCLENYFSQNADSFLFGLIYWDGGGSCLLFSHDEGLISAEIENLEVLNFAQTIELINLAREEAEKILLLSLQQLPPRAGREKKGNAIKLSSRTRGSS
jgi:hypothetical protein